MVTAQGPQTRPDFNLCLVCGFMVVVTLCQARVDLRADGILSAFPGRRIGLAVSPVCPGARVTGGCLLKP